MSTTITLDKMLVEQASPRNSIDLTVELDRPNPIALKIDTEFSEFEARFQAPAAIRETARDTAEQISDTSSEAIAGMSSIDMRELIFGIAAYSIKASCQVIALAAALPFVPRFIGRPIYRRLVRRLQA